MHTHTFLQIGIGLMHHQKFIALWSNNNARDYLRMVIACGTGHI